MNLFVAGYTFTMRLVETEYVRFEDDKDPFCGISITATDLITTFIFDGLGLCRSHLRRIITEIDNTLEGKHKEEYHLRFEDPNVVGGGVFSPISFLIHPGQTQEEDYWEFRYEGNGGYRNSGKTQYSVCLCREDLKNFREDLQRQIDTFNWKEHGAIEYYEIHLPEHELETAYSAEELRAELSSLLTGITLKKLFVSLYGFIDSSQRSDNKLDFTYMGGACLLVFDDGLAVEFCIHGEGMVRYHIFYDLDPRTFVRKTGFAPKGTYFSDSYYYDLASNFKLKYEDYWVKAVEVFPTDDWPFYQSWFDEEKAAASGQLPNLIKLNMSNGVRICLEGDSTEYYQMWVEEAT